MQATHDARAAARAVAHAQRAVLDQTPRRNAPQAVVTLPLLSIFAAETLAPSPRALFLHLWTSARSLTNAPLPWWFWHTDAQLTRETGISARTLLRCRNTLRDAGLLYVTTNQGCPYHRTYYHLRYPCPLPAASPPNRTAVWAAETAHNGHPASPFDAWTHLPERADEARQAAELVAAIATTARQWQDHRLRLAARIPEVSPWLYRQLQWAAPELYQADVLARTYAASGQLSLAYTPETEPPCT